MERPAIIVDNHVIFPDGAGRKLTLRERFRRMRGKLTTVPRRNARHDCI